MQIKVKVMYANLSYVSNSNFFVSIYINISICIGCVVAYFFRLSIKCIYNSNWYRSFKSYAHLSWFQENFVTLNFFKNQKNRNKIKLRRSQIEHNQINDKIFVFIRRGGVRFKPMFNINHEIKINIQIFAYKLQDIRNMNLFNDR